MKIEEPNIIIAGNETENIPLSGKNGPNLNQANPKIFPKKHIIIIILCLFTLFLLVIFIKIFFGNTKKNSKGIEHENYRLSIYTNERRKKSEFNNYIKEKIKNKDFHDDENELIGDKRGNKLEEIDENDDDNEEGKDVNQPLKKRKSKESKLFDDDDNEENGVGDNDRKNKK